jgi:heme oxygenase
MEYDENQKKDIEKRQEEFRKEYLELTKKYEIDFASYPQFVSVGNGVFAVSLQMMLADRKFTPQPSPLNKPIIQ